MSVDENIIALFIPIVTVSVIGLVAWAFFSYRYKTRLRVQETIQAALERGAELTPELIDRMAGPKPGPDRDLRRALILIAIGIGSALFGFLIDDEDALRAMAAVGALPFMVGLAYLVMWRIENRGS